MLNVSEEERSSTTEFFGSLLKAKAKIQWMGRVRKTGSGARATRSQKTQNRKVHPSANQARQPQQSIHGAISKLSLALKKELS